MKKKKRIGIALLAIFALAICGFVGYELFDTKINLNSADSVTSGNWCVKLRNIDTPSLSGNAKSDSVSIKGTKMKFNAIFSSTEDSITYDVQLVNCGTEPAYLYSINMNGLEEANGSYNIEGIEEGDTLKPDDNVTLTINVLSNVSKETNLDLELDLNLSQSE